MIPIRTSRVIAISLSTLLVAQVLEPVAAYALTSGPNQPEYSSYTPVAAGGLVNEYNGAFTYGIPLLTVPGPSGSSFPVTLNYASGASLEDEASWVGLGWSLTAGAISRNVRGLPDDAKGAVVRKWNKVEPNVTVTGKVVSDIEVASQQVNLTAGAGVRYNSYRGFSLLGEWSLSSFGITIGLRNDMQDGNTWSAAINPWETAAAFGASPKENRSALDQLISKSKTDRAVERKTGNTLGQLFGALTSNLFTAAAAGERPSSLDPGSGSFWTLGVGLTGDAAIPIGARQRVVGTYAYNALTERYDVPTYGYMYLSAAPADAETDYTTEKLAPFSSRDRFLGIPFLLPDGYSLLAPGLSGAFRPFRGSVGTVAPRRVENTIIMGHAEGVFHPGVRFGPGLRAGGGLITTTLERWGNPGPAYSFSPASPPSTYEPVFFRMQNDLGGNVDVVAPGSPTAARISDDDPLPASTGIGSLFNQGERAGRATFIGYHTNEEMMRSSTVFPEGQAPRKVYYLSETRSSIHRDYVDRADTAYGFQSQIGEFFARTPSGMRYVFGLPTYARGECMLQYGLDDIKDHDIDSSYIAYRSIDSNANRVVGEVRAAPYAKAYLLTEITTPDYRDLTYDGPSDDDLGGWVRFDYRRPSGFKTKSAVIRNIPWYKWRSPYQGLRFHENSSSSDEDDFGSATWGEKEIYYLKAVETKTHVALFITNRGIGYKGIGYNGSGIQRHDAYEAVRSELEASGSRSATTAIDDDATNVQERLERIELYAKDSSGLPGKLLQRIHFQYDYSLCPNLPNSSPDGLGGRRGKLTLRKVWSESGGVVEPRVSPYVFGYEYRDSSFYPASIRSRYGAITSFGDRVDDAQQNPSYSVFASDIWGSYKRNGASDHVDQFPWNRQTDTLVDPAAWNLKWIRLPSGGEIQVQYEHHQYLHVQDRGPMAMARIRDHTPDDDIEPGRFAVDLETNLGITTDAGWDSIATLTKRLYLDSAEKAYFSILYSLKPGYAAGVNSCTSERIDGYMRVSNVEQQLVSGKRCLMLTLAWDNDDAYSYPEQVAYDFARKHRMRDARTGLACRATETAPMTDDASAALETLLWLIGSVTGDLATTIGDGISADLPIDYEHSYIRLPLTRPKIGGGARVKRILTFDPGLQSSAAALYGTEYRYLDEEGRCTGVAANEPDAGREENALVHEVARREELKFFDRVMSGPDRVQREGPLGEMLLPAPAVAYSSVTASSIHEGATAPGFVVKRFWTYRDYPTAWSPRFDPEADAAKNLPVQMSPINRDEFNPPGFSFIFTYLTSELRLTQAFRLVQTSMPGQPRSATTYIGKPDQPATWGRTAETRYTYHDPGAALELYAGPNQTATGTLGIERDVAMESRCLTHTIDDGFAELDPDVALLIIPAFTPTVGFGFSTTRELLATHVTSEVIRYPAVLKEVTTYADGVERTVAQTSFDPQSGAATVTVKDDGFNGKNLPQSPNHVGRYWAQTIPYLGILSQAAMNQGLVLTSGEEYRVERRVQSADSVYLNIRGLKPGVLTRVESLLVPGDVVELRLKSDTTKLLGIYSVSDVEVPRVWLQPLSVLKQKSGTTDEVVLSVLRSGYANLPRVPAGALVSYGQLRIPFHIAP